MNRMTKAVAIALTIAGLVAWPLAFAQEESDATPPQAPESMQDMQEMMQGEQDHGGTGMMPMMNMMSQMNEMMKTCNTMMQAMMSKDDTPSGESTQPDGG